MPRWTNKSVLEFAKNEDPIIAMERQARAVTLEAMDSGWSGPPFDPIKLAQLRGISVTPKADVSDAQIRSADNGELIIEFNPARPRGRLRFSIAHEIAHSFFADCAERVRHRTIDPESEEPRAANDWQLEILCNMAASELLMPIGSFSELVKEGVEINHLMELRKKFDVSSEAILLRAVKLSRDPIMMFCASPRPGRGSSTYRLDYAFGSRGWPTNINARRLQPSARTLLAECTAIGYTAKGTERWEGSGFELDIECVAIPPFPGARLPRVAGIVRPTVLAEGAGASKSSMCILRGDALRPRGEGTRLICHIVNDRTSNWGGAGFATQLRRRYPLAQDAFRLWAKDGNLKLGQVHFVECDRGVHVASMVAQRGYGPSPDPRIRYAALEQCLERVRERASELRAAVHMPRIGVGNAGGAWPLIEELIVEKLVACGISVTVYDLPERPPHGGSLFGEPRNGE